MILSHLNVGEMIRLGHYPQGANGEIQPIEWKVLTTLPDRALVLAEKVLDWQTFHIENAPTRWEHSSLREWLTQEFFQTAFTEEEQEVIFHPENTEDPTGDLLWSLFGMETTTDAYTDPIFLLGVSDINEFYPNESSLFCPGAEAQMTPWAEAQNPEADQIGGNVSWWLRSSFSNRPMAYIVSPVASVGMSVISAEYAQGVRPAMWVKY